MSYTNISKPGMQSYTNISKPTGSSPIIISVGMATGLLIPLTYSTSHTVGSSLYIKILKPSASSYTKIIKPT